MEAYHGLFISYLLYTSIIRQKMISEKSKKSKKYSQKDVYVRMKYNSLCVCVCVCVCVLIKFAYCYVLTYVGFYVGVYGMCTPW